MGRNSIKDNSRCTGCGVCVAVCPKNAIHLSADAKGFSRPTVGDDCISCGACVKKCHEHNAPAGKKVLKAFTAYTTNASVRNVSSSGGVFSELATAVLENGGFVCAAGFDRDFALCHQIVDAPEHLDGLRKSKYVESRIAHIWKDLKDRVAVKGQTGMFVGTPCQCAALRTYLGPDADKLLICDFVCHGVGSPRMFEKCKAHLKKNFGSALKIEFRHKVNGEGSFFYYEGEKGTYMVPNYTKSYPYAYASGLIIADDCTVCKYCSQERYGDITLGDYVGGPTDYSKSTIFVNTPPRLELLKQCPDLVLEEEDIEQTVARSWHLTTPNSYNPRRQTVFQKIDKDWEYIEKKYFHKPSRLALYRAALLKRIRKLIQK